MYLSVEKNQFNICGKLEITYLFSVSKNRIYKK